jgi:hypothetical protein
MDQRKNRYCYVCGFDLSTDQDLYVKFGTTCPCCVYEYGIDDTVYGENSFMEYRKEWIEKGLPYNNILIDNELWNLEAALMQLSNLGYVNINDYFLGSTIKENYAWTSKINRVEIMAFWKRNH